MVFEDNKKSNKYKNKIKVGGVIVAAGLSSRMGKFKPLLPLKNTTIIQSAINSMFEANVDEISVVLGFRGEDIEKVVKSECGINNLKNQTLKLVYNNQYFKTDMLESIKIGINELENCDIIFILPGDMPAISSNTFKELLIKKQETDSKIIFPTFLGRTKHPVLIDKKCIPFICNYREDGGLRKALENIPYDILYMPTDDYGCTLDADTKDEYENLIKYYNKGAKA
ncbi:nucleotidyltransferase family protein [Clostridium sp. ZS1]|uniref:nucleotidyltransferase family protein n=1 Tax=Clostridium sp. ZS1 TaxID=2949989 RepID=UPI00207A9E42|nr:nucleotidyltransferase family protein [Clostridium sp. ZS1]MBN1038085.1 nucleotidyltransferase family protein [Clostridium botulinum]